MLQSWAGLFIGRYYVTKPYSHKDAIDRAIAALLNYRSKNEKLRREKDRFLRSMGCKS